MQKSEKLHEFGAAPNFDAPYAVLSLASTSLAWPDQTAPQLHPLQLLLPDCIRFSLQLFNCVLFSGCSSAAACYHTHAVQISPHIHYRFHHYACCYILLWFFGWAYFQVVNVTLCNNLQRKWGVGIFSGVSVFSRDYSIT